MKKKIGFNSHCVRDPQWTQHNPPHQVPIHAASYCIFDSIKEGMAIFDGEQSGHVYSRFGNPTIDAVADKIAQLEGHQLGATTAGLLTSSGMAAISLVALGLLEKGDKIVTQADLYGGTTALFQQILQPLGFKIITANLRDLDRVEALLSKDSAIKMLYSETPSNPVLRCLDLPAIAQLAKAHDVITVMDNTFATPVLQQPLAMGIDFVLHSTTKFLNGHGTGIAGALVSPHEDLIKERLTPTLRLLGSNVSPWEAWLVHNGMKTLALRMKQHSENARQVADFLKQHPKVVQVNALSLEDHPDFALAQRQMNDTGGMISFELEGGLEAGKAFMNRLQFCTLTPTLGDVDSLILHPATMSHRAVPKEVREAHGIPDGLVRISVGIEDVEDIIVDLEQAIN